MKNSWQLLAVKFSVKRVRNQQQKKRDDGNNWRLIGEIMGGSGEAEVEEKSCVSPFF